jgi:hypothetical protein
MTEAKFQSSSGWLKLVTNFALMVLVPQVSQRDISSLKPTLVVSEENSLLQL